MRRTAVLVLCLLTFASGAAAAERAAGRHVKPRAERNIMAAHRVLGRWNVGLVNPRTRLLRNNVWVSCSGRGSRTRAGYTQFRCVVGYRRVRVSVRYVAKTNNGFELHDRRTYRV